MDFGFVFMGDAHIHGDVKYAEDKGFSYAWLCDSQMLGVKYMRLWRSV